MSWIVGGPTLPRLPRCVATGLALLFVSGGLSVSARAAEDEQFGTLSFPRDEHVHTDGWDFWWGAADIVAKSGNRYTVGIGMASVQGYGISGHQIFPWQGPHKGSGLLTQYGPPEWGHPNEATPGRYYRNMSRYVEGVSELERFETIDLQTQKVLDTWERTTLDRHDYRFTIDDPGAVLHPKGKTTPLKVDLEATMHKPPLLVGGQGTFWYGVPQAFDYPSRSFQYMQSAQKLTGSLQIGGTKEIVDPKRSTLVFVHEYDATPEDIPLGLALAFGSQVHERYATYYQGGMPWELIFADMRNGYQLFLAMIAFQDTERGALRPLNNMGDYHIIATVRRPDGRSIVLDDRLRVEHLSYRTIIGKVPTFMTFTTGIWKQAWTFRVRYPGGKGVPAFDLGIASRFKQNEPPTDDAGNAEVQRVPLVLKGSWDGCPAEGFAWSELIVNWYRHEREDPWWTGGNLPRSPARC
jgi:hypothetical protein